MGSFFAKKKEPLRTRWYDNFVQELPEASDKAIAITGTTTGVGLAIARACLLKDAKVLILLNRASTRADKSREELEAFKEQTKAKTELHFIDCDLMSLKSVEEAAKQVNEICAVHGGLDILANNAGIMAFPDKRTEDGYELQMQVNHIAHMVLMKDIMPSLMKCYNAGREVRVVQQSSGARRYWASNLQAKYFQKCPENTLGGNGMWYCFHRYHQTKLANSCFALAFHDKIVENGLDAKRFKSTVSAPGYAESGLAGNTGTQLAKLSFFNKLQGIAVMLLLWWVGGSEPQTSEDGSMNMLQCMLGKETEGGDFYNPSEGRIGLPYRGISQGKYVKNPKWTNEHQTLSKENQKIVWDETEMIVGKIIQT